MSSAADFYFDPAGPAALAAEALAAAQAGKPIVVAYQGEPGAYSEQAVKQLFARESSSSSSSESTSGVPAVTPLPCPSFSAVFDAVASGAAPYCLVPIENSLGGSIHDNYDLLLRNRVTCVAELQFKVSHCLLALPGVTLQDLKEVYSHPQALAQCESYTSKLGLTAVKQYDTAGSAKMIAEKGLRTVAAIASELAASTYGLNILARRIEDDEGNFTRFLLLAPTTTRNQQQLYFQPQEVALPESAAASSERGRSMSYSGVLHPNVANLRFSSELTRTTFKTSLVCTLPDAPGALFKALSVFALRDMQMCKIESRPCKHVNFITEGPVSRASAVGVTDAAAAGGAAAGSSSSSAAAGDAFKYLFFIDTLSSLNQNESLKNGVRHLREYAPFLRVLGSYPVFQKLASPETSAASSSGSHTTADAATSPVNAGIGVGSGAKKGLRIGILGFGSFGQFLSKTFVAQSHTLFVHSRSDYSALSKQLGVEWVARASDLASKQLDVLILSMSILSFESTVKAMDWKAFAASGGVLIVDVLSVKVHPKTVLQSVLASQGVEKSVDLLCTHPMFGPESGKFSWKGLAMMFDPVAVRIPSRSESFLEIFRKEGCRMLEMSCETHDAYAAGSQFLTHTTGRILAALNPTSTPINTAGYAKLLQVVEQTQKDSWELYQGLYKFNQKSQEQLEKFGEAFEQIRARLKADSNTGAGGSSSSSSSSASVELNPLVCRMNESKTAAIADLTKSLIAQGQSIVSLSVGEVLSVKTPPQVIQAALEAMQAGHTTYTATNGLLSLRQAICSKLSKENGLSYTPDQVLVSNGAKQSIFQVLQALVTPTQNEVIIPAPYWVSYPDMVTLVGGSPRIVVTTSGEGWILSPAKLEAAITPRTKVLIMCSPSNPTGAVYSKEQLQALVAVLERHPHVHVLSDEIYETLLFDGAVHHSFASLVSPSLFARTHTINGFSKGFVMTGFRVGYLASGSTDVARAASKIQGQITSCACSISQHAALAALALGGEFRTNLVATLAVTRGLLLQALRAIPLVHFHEPRGAFYVLIDVSAYFNSTGKDGRRIKDSDDLCVYLLKQHRVALVPGSAFGAPDCLRISYASSDEIVVAGAHAIKAALQELKINKA